MHLKIFVMVFFLFTSVGSWVYVIKFQSDKYVWITPKNKPIGQQERSVAAVNKMDSNQYTTPVRVLSQKHIGNYLRSVSDDNSLRINIPNFAVRGKERKWNLSCYEYSYLKLTFKARGLAVSGEIPSLTVYSACQLKDVDNIYPINIPTKLVRDNFINNKETHYDSELIKIKINGLANDWPESWVLSELSLSNADTNQSEDVVVLTSEELEGSVLKNTEPIIIN